ncbi:Sperm-tail PG-rich repeat [Carpediemonas membranifera]|uniref:Sperm-tail PG-rich repeat n=1 Tax=Carpediemonas membranifera TaxID=201153 RepID=A0A8J6AYX4_9EUKA|nr:Sperm-tail PG-rich repeat [Carpediemonas membranifera]|eukprot:KAG9390649.1 Sperm-tail PG-rich repeat [Carpediemonas membranifera]
MSAPMTPQAPSTGAMHSRSASHTLSPGGMHRRSASHTPVSRGNYESSGMARLERVTREFSHSPSAKYAYKQTSQRFEKNAAFSPGPGAYNVDQVITITKSGKTVRAPFASPRPASKPTGMDIPGPGSYSPEHNPTLTPAHGAYKVTSGRFKSDATESPGPGAYHSDNYWTKSKRPSSARTSSMGSQARRSPWLQGPSTPGPGQYSVYTPTSGPSSRASTPGGASFNTTSRRFDNYNEEVPGPGAYHRDRVYRREKKPFMISSSSRSTGGPKSESPGPGAYFV